MAERIPQSESIHVILKGRKSDGDDAVGLAPVCTISRAGSLFGDPSSGPTVMDEIEYGWYDTTLSPSDVGLQGPLIVRMTAPTMEPSEITYNVLDPARLAHSWETANAVWESVTADHTTAGTIGQIMSVYSDDMARLHQSIAGIGSPGGSLNLKVTGDNTLGPLPGVAAGVAFVGTQTNAYTDTEYLDGTPHSILNVSDNLDIVYAFNAGMRADPVAITWKGFATPANRVVTVQAWDYADTQWDTIDHIDGQDGTGTVTKILNLYPEHMGQSGIDHGFVYLRFVAMGQDLLELHTDHLFLAYLVVQPTIGYIDGAVWVNTLGGTPGDEPFENGTADNPVDNIADATTLANMLGLRRFHIYTGSAITLSNDLPGWSFIGEQWGLTLNGKDIAGSYVEGALVLGTSINPLPPSPFQADRIVFRNCVIGNIQVGTAFFDNCQIFGTFQTVPNAQYTAHDSMDGTPAIDASPIITLDAGVVIGLRAWCGGVEFANSHSTNTLSIDGAGAVTLGSTCVDGSIIVRGPFKIENNTTGFAGIFNINQRLGDEQKVSTVTGALGSAAVNSVWSHIVEGTTTVLQGLRGIMAATFGKFSGSPGTLVKMRNIADTKDRITATVDSSGNRTSITTDLT